MKKRKRKRRGRDKNRASGAEVLKADFRSLNLRVLSKTKWRQLRNTYLNLQRKNMKDAKKRLRDWRSTNNEGADEQVIPSVKNPSSVHAVRARYFLALAIRFSAISA